MSDQYLEGILEQQKKTTESGESKESDQQNGRGMTQVGGAESQGGGAPKNDGANRKKKTLKERIGKSFRHAQQIQHKAQLL